MVTQSLQRQLNQVAIQQNEEKKCSRRIIIIVKWCSTISHSINCKIYYVKNTQDKGMAYKV